MIDVQREQRVRIDSPLAGGPCEIAVREYGDLASELVVVHLHGGWGYAIYPIDAQIGAFGAARASDSGGVSLTSNGGAARASDSGGVSLTSDEDGAARASGGTARIRWVVPDRAGYGASSRLVAGDFPPRFHEAGAIEIERVLDALGIEQPIVWGHSDGAVIAAWLAIRDAARSTPRYRGIVLESLHAEREKPGSRQFFVDMAEDPERFGPRVVAIARREHGERWREVFQIDGRAWLAVARDAARAGNDLFDGALGTIVAPTLILHGANDPRTEPGELDAIRRALPHASVAIVDDGGHCPHAHPRVQAVATAAIARFIAPLTDA